MIQADQLRDAADRLASAEALFRAAAEAHLRGHGDRDAVASANRELVAARSEVRRLAGGFDL